MEFMDVIAQRRSIRKYDSEKTVSREKVEKLIQAAIMAPSWKNSQTARYHCVMSEEKLERLKNECLPDFNRNSAADASALIICTFIKNRSGFERDGSASNEVGNGWGYYDLGMHNENLLLKAKDMGLDTLVMGIRDEEKIRGIFQIDEAEQIVSIIAVGYAAQEATMPKRKEVEDIAKFY